MAAFEVIALDTATPQLRAPGASDTYTFPRAVELPLGTANGVLYLDGSKVVTSGSGLVFDSSGNLGLGVTPSAWGSSWRALELPNGVAYTSAFGVNYQSTNAYHDGTNWIYKTSSVASFYQNGAGSHSWHVAPSGTAGNAISFTQAMTLDASGNLGVGTTSPRNAGAGYNGITLNGTTSGFLDFNTNGTRVLTIFGSGNDAWFSNPTATGALLFGTNNTERARIDSAGNLGLGVTPSAWSLSNLAAMQIKNGGIFGYDNSEVGVTANAYYNASWKYIASAVATQYQQASGEHRWFNAPSGTAGNPISFTQAMTLDASGNLVVGTTSALGTTAGRIVATVNGSTSALVSLGVGGTNTGTYYADASIVAVGSKSNIPLSLQTNDTERARITSGGDFVIGDTTTLNANAKLSVWNSSAGGSAFGIATGYGTTAGQFRLIYLNSTADALNFDNGNNNATLTSGGTWTNASDARLKKNIQPIKYGLETVLAAQPRSFNRVDVAGDYIGFIAQELQTHIPEVVYGDENTKYSVDYGSLVAVAFKAIQEQQALITALTARVAALET